jgi:signal transduction histidine kinase
MPGFYRGGLLFKLSVNNEEIKMEMDKDSSERASPNSNLDQLDISCQDNKIADVFYDEESVINREKKVIAREESAYLRENAAGLRENAASFRENAAGVREEAASSREEAANIREGTTISGERDLLTTEKLLSALGEHSIKLQQANAYLVVAALEARKQAAEIEAAKVQMEIAKSIAEKANLAKSVFLSNMSHELRTPLNAILGFSQLLEIGPPQPSDIQAEKLKQIVKAGWYLLDLINGILDHAAIESGGVTLILEPVPVEITMLESLAMIESQAMQRDIAINFIPIDKSWCVNADRIRLKQVLINLLSNAIKYNRERGTIEVKCTCISEHIRISIKDSGIGLAPEKVAQLFQPFNRLGQEAGSEEGTGLGLVVTKQLVELMGGSINVESTLGEGSEFRVELYRADAPPQS